MKKDTQFMHDTKMFIGMILLATSIVAIFSIIGLLLQN